VRSGESLVLYRFRVRSADGQELTSAELALDGEPATQSPLRSLSLVMQDDEGAPRAGLKFTLTAGSAVTDGTTGAGGELEAQVPGDVAEATLTLHGARGDEKHTLAIGGKPAAGDDDSADD
jgi:hypothetical protein